MRTSIVVFAIAFVSGCAGRTAPDAAGDGGAVACAAGTIDFVLHAAPGYASQYCVGAPNTCSAAWLELETADGAPVVIDEPCLASCDDCAPVGCPASCPMPSHLGESGVTRRWDGTTFALSTCGGASCQASACAPAGRYAAKMCVYAEAQGAASSGACSPTDTPTCATVGFDWPPRDAGAATVEGRVGAVADGGLGCCPAGYFLYDCTFADGSPGRACHDPRLGCASSTTCGEGCDPPVTGACEG